MAGLVAGNAGAFVAGGNFEPPDRVLKKAVLDAVYFAGERKRATYLRYLEDNATFLVADAEGMELSRHSVFQKWTKELEDGGELPEVSFRAIGPLSGPEGGKTVYRDDTLELARVSFHAGSCVPFLATIQFREKSQTLFFDPFSGYALKEEGE